jgi:ribosomal protein S13
MTKPEAGKASEALLELQASRMKPWSRTSGQSTKTSARTEHGKRESGAKNGMAKIS